MIRQISLIFITAGVISAGCHSQKQTNQANAGLSYVDEAQQLRVRLDPAKNSGKGDLMLSFTVVNNTGKTLRFCKWETPFEPRIGKYFEIKDSQGNEATFKGPMARRVMPPPASAFITVAAHSNVRAVINLEDNYQIDGSRFTVRYIGGGVSGLRSGNKVDLKR